MKVGIHQPNLFPYYSYFRKIALCDEFIFLDDVSLNKIGYAHRVGAVIDGVAGWIIAPLKDFNVMKLRDAEFANEHWKLQLVKKIAANYGKAKFYSENAEFINSCILSPHQNLCDYNIENIVKISLYLNLLERKFHRSSGIDCSGIKALKLVGLVKAIGGTEYVSGESGKAHEGSSVFTKNGINLIVQPELKVSYEPNNSTSAPYGLTILDMLFNIGRDKTEEIIKK